VTRRVLEFNKKKILFLFFRFEEGAGGLEDENEEEEENTAETADGIVRSTKSAKKDIVIKKSIYSGGHLIKKTFNRKKIFVKLTKTKKISGFWAHFKKKGLKIVK
jgi:hypothetical protein